jgi:hypothetical protein
MPNHVKWAVEDVMTRLERITGDCRRLLAVMPNDAMKMTVMSIQLSAQESITDLERARNGGGGEE